MKISWNARIIALPLFAMVFEAASLAAQARQNAPVDLVGRVILPKGAAAMPTITVFAATPKKDGGAMAMAYPDCGKETHPDAMGDFKIRALDPALKFKIIIAAAGCKLQILDRFDPVNGPFTSYLELADPHLGVNNSVRGRVVDLKGAPIPNALVTVTGVRRGTRSYRTGTVRDGDFIVMTDAHGEFVLSSRDPYANRSDSSQFQEPVTDVLVQAEARGFIRQRATLRVGDASGTRIEMPEGNGMIQGIVTLPDGQPAAGADVAIEKSHISLTLNNTKLVGYANVAVTDATGHFTISSDPDGTSLFATHAGGVGVITLDEYGTVRGPVKISLQPWGALQGQYRIGNRPGSNTLIQIASFTTSTNNLTLERMKYTVTTDAEGRFEFTNLPPGRLAVIRQTAMPNGGRRGENIADVEIEPGQVAKITIGGNGRTVIGKVVLQPAEEILPPPTVLMRIEVNDHNCQVDLEPDNSFYVEELPAGEARITVTVMETSENDPRSVTRRSVGSTTVYRTIPSPLKGQSNGPVDVGDIEVAVQLSSAVGRTAPDFTARTADSEELRLVDFRGKFVLLDLAASVPGRETAAVEKAASAFSKSNNFMAITLCLKDTPATINNNNLPWKLGFVTRLLSQYGINNGGSSGGFGSGGSGSSFGPNLPAVFLIGPDGKFLAVRVKPDEIYQVVSDALGGK